MSGLGILGGEVSGVLGFRVGSKGAGRAIWRRLVLLFRDRSVGSRLSKFPNTKP